MVELKTKNLKANPFDEAEEQNKGKSVWDLAQETPDYGRIALPKERLPGVWDYNKQLDDLLGDNEIELEDLMPLDVRYDFDRIIGMTEKPDETKDRMKSSLFYSIMLNKPPSVTFNLLDELNKIAFKKPIDVKKAMAEYGDYYLGSKNYVGAIRHGFRRAGAMMTKQLAGAAKMVGELTLPTPKAREKKVVFPTVRDWGIKQSEKLIGWSDMMLAAIEEYYRENKAEVIQITPGIGYWDTLNDYVTEPTNLVQGIVESSPLILEGILGNIFGGTAAAITTMGVPISGEVYANARAEDTEVLPAMAQAILTGTGEATIEQWTLSRKLGLMKNFKRFVADGLPKITWEGIKVFFRGTAEEGSQEFNRNFWRWVFTDRSQQWTENIKESMAAGGPMELAMAGVFSAAGVVGPSVPKAQQLDRIDKIQEAVEKEITLTEEHKTEIRKELDTVRKQVEQDQFEVEVVEMERELAEIQRGAMAEIYPTEAIPAPEKPAEAIIPEKAVEVAPEVKGREITKQKRTAITKQIAKQIQEHDIYQEQINAIQDIVRKLPPKSYMVALTKEKIPSEVRDFIGSPKEKEYKGYLWKYLTTREEQPSAMGWDEALERVGRSGEDIETFLELLDMSVQLTKVQKGILNQQALDMAIRTGEPSIELLAMKYDMIREGYTPDEINDTIEQFFKEYPEIGREVAEAEFIKVEEKDYVKEEPRVLPEVERKGRKVKAKLTPEQVAFKKAKERATTKKEVVFVFKKDGKYIVSKNPPKNIPYTKISPPKGKQITAKVERIGPKAEEAATQKQKARAHIIAKEKGLLSEKGKPKPNYRYLAKAMTGQTSMTMMTQEQANTFIDALESLVQRIPGRPAKIPRTTDLITKELADKIEDFKDIGFLEKFRPAWRVFEKIGLIEEVFEPVFTTEVKSMEELFAFREKAEQLQNTVGKDDSTAAKLFRELENPETQKLSKNEQKVVKWAKKFFDDWANRLKLSTEKRIKNYVTHIFEQAIAKDLKAKYPLDPELIKALEFITPKTVFNPFLQKRLGKKLGLKENIWSALEAYENKALKKFYYEPLIQRIRVYQKFLPPNAARYLRDYIARITNRPLVIDREINQTMKEIAGEIEKMPQGKQLAEYLTRGNAAGMLAYNMTGIYYECWLGLRPASAIKNLSQHGLILCETGPIAFTKALTLKGEERAGLLDKSVVLKGRKSGFLPGIDQTYIKLLENKRRAAAMFMFKMADRKNVSDAFLAGYYEAKEKGLSEEWSIKRGDEVARKTQYLYTKFAGSQFNQTAPGRVLGVLTTWPMNWAELMNDWIQGKPSTVYNAYEKQTGQKITQINWIARRKALWTYLAMVSLAMLIHKKTPFKALYYTGWTSVKMLADLASGKLAGLTIPRITANLIVGVLLLDEKRLKSAWSEMEDFVVIFKELKDIYEGEKDWINLFIYLEEEKPKKPKKIQR